MSVFCVCVCVVLCVCTHSTHVLPLSFSVRRMHSWSVQAIGNGEDYAIPPEGSGERVTTLWSILLPNVWTIVMRRLDPVSLVMPHLIVLGNRGP